MLRWNKAFEKIGFKNVMHIEDFPKDDPEFDPDNLKYSCIRYVPAAVANAMGPSWVDPRSGEIINASVLMYNDVVKLAANWRFVQTAQVDERVRGKELPDDVFQESLEYILAHEVGHCLGLMHNMAASSAFPVDSLRSASFTQQHGTTPSIMDYARFNYVAQPGDKGVKLTPPDLGPYDDYVIKYAYTPQEYMDDLYNIVFESTIKGGPVSPSERLIQRMFVDAAADVASSEAKRMKLGGIAEAYAPSVDEIALLGLDRSGIVERYLGPLREAEEEHGKGYVASQLWNSDALSSGYGWQYNVQLRSIDESRALFVNVNDRILKLLRSRVKSATGETRAHYQGMIYVLERSLFPSQKN